MLPPERSPSAKKQAPGTPLNRPSALLHQALEPDDPHAKKAAPAPRVNELPTVNSQLNYFAGTWTVRGLGYAANMQGAWHGDWLFLTHPAMPDGRTVRFADAFAYENSAYIRYDQTPHPSLMCVSGGWLGNRWEWQRVDCSARITYDKLDDRTMLVTEEVRDPNAEGRTYKAVRYFEAQRQL